MRSTEPVALFGAADRAGYAQWPVLSRRVFLGAVAGTLLPSTAPLRAWAESERSRDSICQPPPALAGLRAPFLVAFRCRSGGAVHFLGARHADRPEDPTHQLVARLLRGERIDSVIVEGVEGIIDREGPFARSARARMISGSLPENMFATVLALEQEIRIRGGDLSLPVLLRGSLASGVPLEDIMGAYIVRGARSSPLGLDEIEKRVREEFRSAGVELDLDFQAWHMRNYGTAFDRNASYRGPCGAGPVAQVVRSETERRNGHLLDAILAEAARCRNVAVIFGANHLFALFDDLVRLCGPAEVSAEDSSAGAAVAARRPR